MIELRYSPYEDRIDVDHADWLRQKNHILTLEITCRIQFVAILILAAALGFVMFAEPRLDREYSGILFSATEN
ncbi:MAG TPA: hypothetical protein V6D17_20265 [Candidatus Obscuribacterales bacterium]